MHSRFAERWASTDGRGHCGGGGGGGSGEGRGSGGRGRGDGHGGDDGRDGRGARGGRGFGRFGRGFTDGDQSARAFGMGRKLSSGDLQLVILALLDEKPSHGYEIIKALDEKSHGFYVPSPGMIYPALTYLEEIGHATVESVGTRKLYQPTAAGRQHLTDHRETIDSLWAQFARVAEHVQRVRRALGEADFDGSAPVPERDECRDLHRARHELKAALAEKRSAPPEEQQRLADILRKAAAEITGG